MTNHQSSESHHAGEPTECPLQQQGLGSGPLFPGQVCPAPQHAGSSQPVSSHDSGPDTATESMEKLIWMTDVSRISEIPIYGCSDKK